MNCRLAPTLVLLAMTTACGPALSSEDKVFGRRLADLVAGREFGPIPQTQTAETLRTLFNRDVSSICVISGGDWVIDVESQWRRNEASMPAPFSKLRNVGDGDLSLDGMVALVGIDAAGYGWVRRGSFGGECSDYSDPICLPVSSVSLEIVAGRTFDTGIEAGKTMKALRLADSTSARQSCPLEPYPQ